MSSTDQRSRTTEHTTEADATTPSEAREMIAILDYGSQYSRLIARRVRECRVYCELLPAATTLADLQRLETAGAGRVKGVILSGGPDSVYDSGARHVDQAILESDLPVLGICYGMHLLANQLGGHVEPHTGRREYGPAEIWLEPSTPSRAAGASMAKMGETSLAPTANGSAASRSASAQADVVAQPSGVVSTAGHHGFNRPLPAGPPAAGRCGPRVPPSPAPPRAAPRYTSGEGGS